MNTLIKYLIYEHAINVLFYNIKKNLFYNFNLIDFKNQYEQNIKKGRDYNLLTFNENGLIYQFHYVHINHITDNKVYFSFVTAFVFDTMDDDADVELWDVNESPFMMDINTLVECV